MFLFYQITVNTNSYRYCNGAMVINQKTSKTQKFGVLQAVFFSLKFVGTVFVSSII